MNSKNLKDFQEKIQYLFKDKGLLETALTHSSFANEHHLEKHQNNERLEFLGDAVLELVSSDVLVPALSGKAGRGIEQNAGRVLSVSRRWPIAPGR